MARRNTGALTIFASVLVVSAALAAPAAAVVEPVLTTPAAEILPSGLGPLIGWTQNSHVRPRHYDAFVKDGTDPRRRVNPDGTQGFAGGFDANLGLFAYQRVKGNVSDIRFYDLLTDQQVAPPPDLNTPLWEWHVTASDPYILFNRQRYTNKDTWVERIVLYDRTMGTSELLAESEARYFGSVVTGQVNGTWATWVRCRNTCNVFVRDLVTDTTTMIPNPDGKPQYSPSIAADGTVYYVRSGFGCGKNVRLVENDAGAITVLATVGSSRDIRKTYTDDSGVTPLVYFQRAGCRRGMDIYRATT